MHRRISRLLAEIPARVSFLHIFLFGLGLRACYLCQAWTNNELVGYPVVDADVYVNWARQILAGNLLWHEPSNYTPAYPLYLAFWFLLFGSGFKTIFIGFHLLGALQAVALGKGVEHLCGRRVGLLSALICAAYWPFIVFEATFYAENFALWTLSLALYFLARFSDKSRDPSLVASGFFLGLSALARANMFLCFPTLALWLLGRNAERTRTDSGRVAWRRFARISARRLLLFLVGPLLVSAPIAFWNYRISGTPLLRTQAALCLYLGNAPEYGGLIPSPGVEYKNIVRKPLTYGKSTLVREKEFFWYIRTMEIVRDRTQEWAALQLKKLLMHVGRFEVSQEIDIYRFRKASPLLNLPVFPGFGIVGAAAIAGIVLAMLRKRNELSPFLVFAATYFFSIYPFQVAARFRLPLAMSIIPFAGFFVDQVILMLSTRRWRSLVLPLAAFAAALAVVVPDYTDLATRNSVKHWHFIGLKNFQSDPDAALAALEKAAAERPADPDPLLLTGRLYLELSDPARAEESYAESLRRNSGNPEAWLGLARCALWKKEPRKARDLLKRVFEEWPNSYPGLVVLYRTYLLEEDWEMAAMVLEQLRSYVNHPVRIAFLLAAVSEKRNQIGYAIQLYDEISKTERFDLFARDRAAFAAGALEWRCYANLGRAYSQWRKIGRQGRTFFVPLAGYLLGELDRDSMESAFSEEELEEGHAYIDYSLALAAWIDGRNSDACGHLSRIVGAIPADKADTGFKGSVLARWARLDLSKLSGSLEQQSAPDL